MSVLNGQLANQTTFNNAFLSRTAATSSATGIITFSNTTESSSTITGGLILSGGLGVAKNVYSGALIRNSDTTQSTDKDTGAIVTEGGLGVEKNINAGGNILGANLTGSNSGDVTLDSFGSSPSPNGATLTGQALALQPADGANPGGVSIATQSFAGNKTFLNNVIVTGDLTVQGTTTTINSTTLEVVDQNILVNKDGNDASSEGAGLEVERTGTNGSIKYENALTSRFKVGDLGSESEIITAAGIQTITGAKSFSGIQTFVNKFVGDFEDDATATGANATVVAPAKMVKRLTNASLTSIDMISSPLGSQFFVLVNRTGADLVVNNLTGGTAANQILTGSSNPIDFLINASLWFWYDSTSSKWTIVGGSGGGGGTVELFSDTTLSTSGDSIALDPDAFFQQWRIKGNSGIATLSTTPFSADSPDGAMLTFICTTDADPVVFTRNDAAGGVILKGGAETRTLYQYDTIRLERNSTLGRYIEV